MQPADYFLIQKIEDACRHRWDECRLKAVKEGFFNDNFNPHASGSVDNPGKHVYLKLAASAIRYVIN